MSDSKDSKGSIRDRIFIGKIAWCLIQTFILILGMICSYLLGVWIEIKIGEGGFSAPIVFVLIWIIVFLYLKFRVEDEFSDCIDCD